MAKHTNPRPPLEALLVPSILEDKPKCFDRPCNPVWILWVGLLSGTGIAALFGISIRDSLDGRRPGAVGLFLGCIIQMCTTYFYSISLGHLKRGNWSHPFGLITLLLIYLVIAVYCVWVMSYQIPRYKLYCSMGLPKGSNILPATLVLLGILVLLAVIAMMIQDALEQPYVVAQ